MWEVSEREGRGGTMRGEKEGKGGKRRDKGGCMDEVIGVNNEGGTKGEKGSDTCTIQGFI